MKKVLQFVLFCLVALPVSAATTYYVSTSGSDANAGTSAAPFLTVGKCSSTMVAGDTCIVESGIFDETVSVSTSGSLGSRITYESQTRGEAQVYGFTVSRSYITINGFKITDPTLTHTGGIQTTASVTGNTYENNTITEASACIVQTSSSFTETDFTIANNTLSWCNAVPGALNTSTASLAIELYGNHNLIEGNAISHVPNAIGVNGSDIVLRENQYGPVNDAVDFPGCTEGGGCDTHADFFTLGNATYVLLEDNYEHDVYGVGGAHLILMNGASTSNFIDRYNVQSDVGSGVLVFSTSASYYMQYNDTLYQDYVQVPTTQVDNIGYSTTYSGNNSSILNVLMQDVLNPLGSSGAWYSVNDSTGVSTGYELLWDSVCTSSCTYSGLATTDTGNVEGQNPELPDPANGNVVPPVGSPALSAGTNLTTVAAGDSGTGTSLVVNNAAFFQDGLGVSGVNADCIAVTTTTNHVCITAVDYATNTLTLASSVTRTAGDKVWLYSNSGGTVVLPSGGPNIGAVPGFTLGAGSQQKSGGMF